MKACIVGKGPMEFTAGDTGEVIEGVKLYFFSPKDEVDGYFAGEIWVKKTSKLYFKVMSLDTEQPFMAEIEYDVQPGKKRTVAVLSDIRALDSEELERLAENPYWEKFVPLLATA